MNFADLALAKHRVEEARADGVKPSIRVVLAPVDLPEGADVALTERIIAIIRASNRRATGKVRP